MNDHGAGVILVTGASRGIGAATARHFARQGAKVVLAARSLPAIEAIARQIEAEGAAALAVACDVARHADMVAAVEACVARFGRLDVLVNNAGLIEPIARLADSDPDAWDAVVDVNLKGVYHGLRAAIPVMVAQGGGVVVNLSSGAATGVLEGWSHYCATKAAVLSLTRCADLECRAQGVRVVGLSPGTVATEMQVAIKASGINPVSRLDPSVHIPAERVARAIAWLCSDAAADIRGADFSLRDPESLRRAGLED